MKRYFIRRKVIKVKKSVKSLILLVTCAVMVLIAGCSGGESGDTLLWFNFDEGSGTAIADSSGHVKDATVSYQFTDAAYMEDRDPQWRASGVQGGALLFDGCSTEISCDQAEVTVSGGSFSISVWVAPRAYEWDDPNAANSGDQHLTGIAGQFSAKRKTGFMLGYQRFGRPCFEVGDGERVYTLWGSENLPRYEWSYLCAVFDGANGAMKMYLNGEEIGSVSVDKGAEIAAADRKLVVGANPDADTVSGCRINRFCGLMDELKLYNRVLTAEETVPESVPELKYEDAALENILTTDIYKTQYHGGPYEHWMNEPHAPVYYNGMYHLFFQQNIVGTYWRNICWGHLVSEDMVNWRPVKEAIVPTENTVVPDGVWSGNAAYDKNGVPLLFFTAGNDNFRTVSGLISNQNIGVAYPADLNDPELTDWVIYKDMAVTQAEGQGRPGEFRDPYIWQQDGKWCMLICSGSAVGNGGSALLYTTDTLELKSDGTIDMDWKYIGPIYEMMDQPSKFGTSWELPILLPLTSSTGVEKYAFFISPAPAGTADNKVYYFIGDFDLAHGEFTPDPEYYDNPSILDYGDNVFTGPSVMQDPVSGDYYMFSIMQDKRSGAEEIASGWAHSVGLARKIWLNDEGTDLMMEPAEALSVLEGEKLVDESGLDIAAANAKLAEVKEDMYCLRLTLGPGAGAKSATINLKTGGERDNTKLAINFESGTVTGSTTNRGGAASAAAPLAAPFELKDGAITLTIYVDRSLTEAFFNSTKSVSIRSYPDKDSKGISLEAEGNVTVSSLTVTRMNSIYE